MDIIVDDGKIADVLPSAGSDIEAAASQIIDASGKIVTPGLIDLHVHFREPGFEHKETIATGCQAAAAGGFTAVCPMPNTHPVNDCAMVTDFMLKKARETGAARILPVASISLGLKGDTLSNFKELKDAGAVAVSDDGMPVVNSALMRKALEYAGALDLIVISHSEDPDLVADGVMNECGLSVRMGLPGIPNAAESIMVMREIALAKLTGVPIHIAHVSTAESVQAIREAKARGVRVTAETAPHYVTLTHDAVNGYNTNAKMNPPLRSEKDRQAVVTGLKDGTIDFIATDHAPHSVSEKETAFEKAPNGIIGLETALPLGLKLVNDNTLTLPELIDRMSKIPARILNQKNGIESGKPADITIMDLNREYTVDPERFRSLSRNTPFANWRLKGKAVCTIVAGKIIYQDDENG
ncbi:MAG: dihydroorotase [Desulfobacteraceae bacterium]|nr:dihydroorotase [Desulfobacteraceae bacterium]